METNTPTNNLTFTQARNILREFVKERQWEKFHTPRNLMLALVGQIGQLSQIFQWKGQVTKNAPQLSEKEKTNLSQQLADVLCYLIRLSDMCGIQLSQAFQDKMTKNRKKYPSEQVRGSLTTYQQIKQKFREKKINDQ